MSGGKNPAKEARKAANEAKKKAAAAKNAAARWTNWLSAIAVCHRQVQRALSAASKEREGECGLAVVATATMLEAYVNLHATSEFANGQKLIPEHLLEPYRRLSAKHRFQLLPRFAGRLDPARVALYEDHAIHATIQRVFSLRNQFVHGNLDEWNPVVVTTSEVAKLWNGALEMLLVLETFGEFRIPKSRLAQYEAELATMKVTAT
jgi:hypothetical protein